MCSRPAAPFQGSPRLKGFFPSAVPRGQDSSFCRGSPSVAPPEWAGDACSGTRAASALRLPGALQSSVSAFTNLLSRRDSFRAGGRVCHTCTHPWGGGWFRKNMVSAKLAESSSWSLPGYGLQQWLEQSRYRCIQEQQSQELRGISWYTIKTS